jgi:polyribonucleotide nucleotidyltransferase
MVTMKLDLQIDGQKFMQQVQSYNQEVEKQVQEGLDRAFKSLSEDGTMQELIEAAVKKNVMDSFSRWVFQSDIRQKIEKALTDKLSAKIDTYTDGLVNEIAEKMNLPK